MRLLRTTPSRWKIRDLCYLLYYLFVMVNMGASSMTPKPPDATVCPASCKCVEQTGVVNCSGSGFREIPKYIPRWVTNLSLHNNKLSSQGLSSFNFGSLPHLQELDFSDNRIHYLTVNLTGTYSLRKIVLNHCSLSTVPDLKPVSNITHLYLSHNSISDLGASLKNLQSLRVLDLSYNRIKELRNIPFSTQGQLTHLYLQRNKMSSLDWNSFEGLHSADTIDLSRNRIRNIVRSSTPNANSKQEICFGHLKSLKHLDLSRNQIAHVNGLSITGMCSLVTLKLNANRINRLSDGAFYGPTDLRTLILDNNQINAVKRGWLFELSSLKTLSASHNNISMIEPDSWDFCKELVHLNLSHNRLRSIVENGFSKLSKLRTLRLDNNKIALLEDNAFNGLSALKMLDVSFNEISSSIEDINGAFHGLSSIENLSLRRNRIRTLSTSVLEGIESVVTLDLRENDVTSIQNLTFDKMRNLRVLQIISSSFLCDCRLAWFPEWLQEINGTRDNFIANIQGSCFHPPALNGRDILTVENSEFVCGIHPIPVLLQEPRSMTALRGENITLECGASATLAEDPSEGTPSPDINQPNLGSRPAPGEFPSSAKGNSGLSPGDILADFTSSRNTLDTLMPGTGGPRPKPGEAPKGTDPSRESFLSLRASEEEEEKEPESKMTIVWKRGVEVLQQGKKIRMLNQTRHEAGYVYVTSTLQLMDVTSDDVGSYSCMISNEYGYVRSKPVQLDVNEFPKFTKTPANVTVVRNGTQARLECAATGHPSPLIIWQKDGGKNFPAATSRRLLREQKILRKEPKANVGPKSEAPTRGSSKNPLLGGPVGDALSSDDDAQDFRVDPYAPLHIGVVLPEDAGEYECVVQSDVGRIIAKAMLIVEVDPVFKKEMAPVTKAVMNQNAVISCSVEGIPTPQVSWRFNGVTINVTSRHVFAASGQVLVIMETSLEDAGEYTCSAWNHLSSIGGKTTLEVYEKAADLEPDVGILAMIFGDNTATGIIIIIVFACVVLTSLVWLIILCYTRKNPEQAMSTNTDDTDLPPDVHSDVSIDDSIRKAHSNHSIHSMENENGIRGSKKARNPVGYQYRGSLSTSDIHMMQVNQNGYLPSCRPASKPRHPSESSNQIYRSFPKQYRSGVTPKDKPFIGRFRSDDNFRSGEGLLLSPRTPNSERSTHLGPNAPPVISPSSYFAKKAASEEAYIPVLLKAHSKSRVGVPSLAGSASSSADTQDSRSRAKKLKKVKVHNQRKQKQNEQSENFPDNGKDSNPNERGGNGCTPCGCQRVGAPDCIQEQNCTYHSVRQYDKTDILTENQTVDSARENADLLTQNVESWRSYHARDRRKNDNVALVASGYRGTIEGGRVGPDMSSGNLGRPPFRGPIEVSSDSCGPTTFSSENTLVSESSALLSSGSISEKSDSVAPPCGRDRERLLTSSIC